MSNQTLDSPACSAAWREVRLGSHPVLGATELVVESGRWTAVVGPNGAGKSTLLKALAGLQPVDGEVRLRGRNIVDWPARERARSLAWLGQGDVVTDGLSAFEVVMLGRLPHRGWLAAPDAADHAAVQTAMQQTQTWQWRSRSLATLSGGERQRVLLARALAVQAGVVLMDEPLSHLDPPHQADWIDLVCALVRGGTTVVSVLHELNIALQADCLIVLGQGRVIHQGAAADPATHAALQTVFDHRLHLIELDGQWLALPRPSNSPGSATDLL